MTTADWAPGRFTTVNSIPGSYSTSTTGDGATIVTSGPYAGFTQTGHDSTTYALTWESPPGWGMPVPTGQALSKATGVNPTETSYALYGHTIPLTVFGVGRIGGEIISGPWIENGSASFCISFGYPADPTGTRTLREIAFDSEVVWTLANGFSNEGFTYRFYGGTYTQAADPLETTHFGSNAVAYRPQILIWFENLPLANTKFGKIPYVSAVFADSSGDDVNLGEAFERLAASPWVNLAEFETTGITDGLVSGGLIITQQVEFLQLIQQFGRFYQSWDILQTDKLRIVDRGSTVTADINLDKSSLMGDVSFARVDSNTVPRSLELSTIDPDSDYQIVPSTAAFPRDPVVISAAIKAEKAYLPAIMDSSTRMAIVTFAKYREEMARKKLSATAMIKGLEIEPGDLVGISGLGDDFPGGEVFKVVETLHGANYSVEFTAEAILNCTPAGIATPEECPLLPALTGMIARWDSSVSDSMTLTPDGTGNYSVSLWEDQSGSNNLSTTLIGNDPLYIADGYNSSYPCVYFSAFQFKSLFCDPFSMGTGNELTIFGAVRIDNEDMPSAILAAYFAPGHAHEYDNAGSFVIERPGTTSTLEFIRNSQTSTASITLDATFRFVITLKSDGTFKFYINGSLVDTVTTTAASFVNGGALWIGANPTASLFHSFLGGAIAEMGICTSWHDASVVADIDAHLACKWGFD
jgi:hypothetical protein